MPNPAMDVVFGLNVGTGGARALAATEWKLAGHAFIKRTMMEKEALFGCEASGHYFFRELNGGDDGLFAALYLTDLVRRSRLSLADLRRTLAPFFVTSDLRIASDLLPFEEIVKRMWSLLPSARATTIDEVRWETKKGYILARQSVAELAVTVRLEGRTRDSFQELIEMCVQAFPEVAAQISGPASV